MLEEIIRDRIVNDGPISFHDFMEMCLYHPVGGYYNSTTSRIGRDGDFYTSPELCPAYAAMIARQIEELWEILGRPPFTIVEYGAGNGSLCRDILCCIQTNTILYVQLKYCIIEKSVSLRRRQQNLLKEKVSWYTSIKELSGFTGCVISNELVDNFAVHQVIMEDELKEIHVAYENGFKEIKRPACSAITSYFHELNIQLPIGYRTEVNLEATIWIKEIADAMYAGFVITVDYGFPSSELYKPYRCTGTLLCYQKHSIRQDPYENIGHQDITSHVNFSALGHWGSKCGLQFAGITDQEHFLKALGVNEYFDEMVTDLDSLQLSQLKHTLLNSLGRKMLVLVQYKNVIITNELSGLKFELQNVSV